MSTTKIPPPMLAKSRGSGPGTTRAEGRAEAPLLPTKAAPEDVFDLLRDLIADDRVGTARRLLAEAVRRFPDHARIKLAQRVLAEGKASPNPFAQPTASAEIEWLREPPEEARGKWVALIGSELVGMADSAADLMAFLRSKHLDQLPVVQYIAP